MISYSNSVDGVAFTWHFDGQIVSVGPGADRVLAQTLMTAAKDAEASLLGMAYPDIIRAGGKTLLDPVDGTRTGLTVQLLDEWVVLTEKQSGLFTLTGGNVISLSFGVNVFAPNSNVTTQNNTSQAATITQGGGGFTDDDRAQLSIAVDLSRAAALQTKTS